MEENQKKSIADFIESVIDDEGYVKEIHANTALKHIDKMLRAFSHVSIRKEDEQKDEFERVASISRAIKNLNRIEVKPTIKAIAKIIGSNHRRTRNIMLKYGMFNEETKEIKNSFEQNPFEWELKLNQFTGDFYEDA